MKRMLMELSLNSKTFLKSEIKKKKNHFLFLNEIESSFSFDFQLKVEKNHFRNKYFLQKELCLDRHPKVS